VELGSKQCAAGKTFESRSLGVSSMIPQGPNFTKLSGIRDKDYASFINMNTARGNSWLY